MIKIIRFDGGLGNQMFQYAFYLSLRSNYPHSFYLFDIARSKKSHNGLEILDLFKLEGKWRYLLFGQINRHLSFLLKNQYLVLQKNITCFEPDVFNEKGKLCTYVGFWQSELYFRELEPLIRQTFSFDAARLSKSARNYVRLIQSTNSISIHIRRGDYVPLGWNSICTDAYYNNAIDFFLQKDSNIQFFVFSDDKEWAEEKFEGKNKFIIVKGNEGSFSWQDMYLMSICKHNIIANSTFSWWAAWLNANKNKTVIAPRQWIPCLDNNDIFPEAWIKLDS